MKNKKAFKILIAIAFIASIIAFAQAAELLVYSSSPPAAEKSGNGKQSTSQKVTSGRACPCSVCKPTAGEGKKWGDCVCQIQKPLTKCSYYCRAGKLSYVRNCFWKK
jgi:hypothetical protein